jgi:hypothetical protein
MNSGNNSYLTFSCISWHERHYNSHPFLYLSCSETSVSKQLPYKKSSFEALSLKNARLEQTGTHYIFLVTARQNKQRNSR